MRPLNLTFAITSSAALLASSLSLSSCAVDGCQVDPSDPRCASVPTSDLTLVTARLPKTGGRLIAMIRNHNPQSRVEATLGTQGPKVTFTEMGNEWVSEVPANVLASIPVGPLSVTLESDGKTATKIVHIFSPPNYSDAMRASLVVTSRQPTWVDVSQGRVFVALDNGTDKRINEYQVTATTFSQLPGRDALFGFFGSAVQFDLSETDALQLGSTGSVQSLKFGSLNDATFATMGYKEIKSLTYTKVGGMAVDRQNMAVAVAGEGTDGPLKVFTVSVSPTTAQLTNAPSNKLAVALGWGLIDNDTQPDLVAIHSDGTAAVYLQKSGTGLTYDQTFSTGLGNAAALQAGMPFSIAVGDVDRDGLDDVIIGQNMQVWQLASEGNGTFTKSMLPGGIGTDAVAVGDVNGDGKLDLVVAGKSPAMLYCYFNQSP